MPVKDSGIERIRGTQWANAVFQRLLTNIPD